MSDGTFNVSIPYTPRGWQEYAEKRLARFTVLVMHRRAGKTVFDVLQSIKAILSCTLDRPRGAYIGVTLSQTRDTAWDYYKEFFKPFNNLIKIQGGEYKELVVFNESQLNIKIDPILCVGDSVARISLYSYEKPDSILGNYLDHVVLDEFQQAPQRMFGQIIRPMLADKGRNGGSCIITGTPRGKNQLFDFYERGLDPEFKDWASILMKWSDTGELDEEEIRTIKMETTEEEYEQEYNCSFEAAIKGSYFGENISKMRKEGRIVDKEYDPGHLVGVAVDIGLDGYAMWYYQKIKGQLILIDCDVVFDKDTADVISILLKKKYIYAYIVIPHDGDDRNAANKHETPAKIFQRAGFKIKRAGKKKKKPKLITAIRNTRRLLDTCQMTKRCSEKKLKIYNKKIAAIDALAMYVARYDIEKDVFQGVQDTTEEHDKYSHLGSALRTLATIGVDDKVENLAAPTQAFRNTIDAVKKNNNKWNPFK